MFFTSSGIDFHTLVPLYCSGRKPKFQVLKNWLCNLLCFYFGDIFYVSLVFYDALTKSKSRSSCFSSVTKINVTTMKGDVTVSVYGIHV